MNYTIKFARKSRFDPLGQGWTAQLYDDESNEMAMEAMGPDEVGALAMLAIKWAKWGSPEIVHHRRKELKAHEERAKDLRKLLSE